jgi:hypothetical protein
MSESTPGVGHPLTAGRVVLVQRNSRLPVFPLGMSLGLFFILTYVICITFDLLFPSLAMYPVWAPLLPGFTWLSWQSFLLGLVEAFGYGWYIALVFGPIYNLLSGGFRQAGPR